MLVTAQPLLTTPPQTVAGLSPFKTRSSHVRTFEDCQRKWYLAEVEGLGTPESAAMQWGTTFHLELENWLRDAKMPSKGTAHGLAALKSLKYLPAPGAGLKVEHRLSLILEDGTVYTGAVDLFDPQGTVSYKDAYGAVRGAFQLYDHKSTAALKWAKSPSDLAADISANFYAKMLMAETGADSIACRWIYTERVGTGCEPRDFVITKQAAETRWLKTRANVKSMKVLADDKPAWQEVLPNLSACSAFGGCQFKAKCATYQTVNKVTNAATNAVTKEGITKMSLLGLLKNQDQSAMEAMAAKKGMYETLKGAIDTTAPEITPDEMIGEIVGLDPSRIASLSERAAFEAVVEAALEAVVDPIESNPMDEGSDEPTFAFGVNPPDAAKPDLVKDTVEKKTRKKREKALTTDEVVERAEVEEHVSNAQVDEYIGQLANDARSSIIANVRKYAEETQNVTAFILANMIERGEL